MDPAAPAPAYRYRATAVRVLDGDSFVARIDLGFRATLEVELRLADVYAAELTDPRPDVRQAAEAARDALTALLYRHPHVIVTTRKTRAGIDRRSFARYVADVTLPDGVDVAAELIAGGHARPA